jgi:DNA invertase Pin-like site-specific DNA recombinase
MNNITSAHLSRTAYVYVRQSKPEQVIDHPESRRRQYALKDRALALGWKSVIVIDDDLGRSGDGTERIGFDRVLAEVCTGKVGAVFAIEDSRLARNGRQWHTLLEFCALVNCLTIDENNIHDPRQANDRLLLGVRGAFSELELSILRQRSQEALRLKAARGELHTRMAVGYVLSDDQKVEMDPDRRVREAIKLIFRKFSEFGSVRQATIWLKEEGIKLPTVVYGAEGRTIECRLAAYSITYAVLKNPVYAGAYVYGRRTSQVHLEGGRKRITRNMQRLREEWEVLIPNHHEGYISWEQYECNQRIINGNANMNGTMVSGAARNGGGLLAGLLRCGHCGRNTNSRSECIHDIWKRRHGLDHFRISFDVECSLHELVGDFPHRFGGIVFEYFLPDLFPDMLLRIQFWRIRGKEAQRDIGGNHKIIASMIASTIHDEEDMPPGKFLGQGIQKDLKAFRVGCRQDQEGASPYSQKIQTIAKPGGYPATG